MRVIIAGSRDIVDPWALDNAIKAAGFEITTVLSGTARGIDRMGERWAEYHKIPVERYPAQWNVYGKRLAGRIRNTQMAQAADALIAVWDGMSSGTAHMIKQAERLKLKVYVHRVSGTGLNAYIGVA